MQAKVIAGRVLNAGCEKDASQPALHSLHDLLAAAIDASQHHVNEVVYGLNDVIESLVDRSHMRYFNRDTPFGG